MIRQKATILLLWLAFLMISVSSETAFSVANNVQCNNGVYVLISEIKCGRGHGNYASSWGPFTCYEGETAHVSGQVVFRNEMPEISRITASFCLFGIWPCKTYSTETLDFCDSFGLFPDDDSSNYTCSTPGTYGFNVSFELPDNKDHDFDYGFGWWVDAKATIEDIEDACARVTTCTIRTSAVSAASISGLFVVSAALATIFAHKRRRRANTDLLARENAREPSGHFNMMKDTLVQG